MGMGVGEGVGWINLPLITQHRLKNFATFRDPTQVPIYFQSWIQVY